MGESVNLYEFKDRDITGEYNGSKYVRLDCILMEDYRELYKNYDNIDYIKSNIDEEIEIKDEYDVIDFIFGLEKIVFTKFIDNFNINIEKYLGKYIDSGDYIINLGSLGAYMDIIDYSLLYNRIKDRENINYNQYSSGDRKSLFTTVSSEQEYFAKPSFMNIPNKIPIEIDLGNENNLTSKVEELFNDKIQGVLLKNKMSYIKIIRVYNNGIPYNLKNNEDKEKLVILFKEIKNLENKYNIIISTEFNSVTPLLNRIEYEMDIISKYKDIESINKILYPGKLVIFSASSISNSLVNVNENIKGLDNDSVGLGIISNYIKNGLSISPILVLNKILKISDNIIDVNYDELIYNTKTSKTFSDTTINHILLDKINMDNLRIIIPYNKILGLTAYLDQIEIPSEILQKVVK